ncbi:DDB1- and CUL4-associated factor 4-like isoform X2 [Dreissena polymorpha]|nr:DDB1- and CUL4-associated factor 4-like isoform X2 [Dreissena polymorpha]
MTLMGYQKHEIRLKLLQNTITRLKPLDSAIVFNADLYSHMQANIDNMLCMHKSDSDAELLCLWSLKDSCAQRIQIVQLCEGKRAADTGSLCLSACPVHRPLLPMTHKVTAMCWAPRSGWQRLVLYTTMGHVFRQESMAVIRCLSENDTEHNQEYCLGRKATWSCAWNPVHNQMSVGSERCALLLNTDRRTMFEYNTNNSDPLAVAFSKQTGMTLYAGLRRGGILMFDLRCRSTIPMLTLHHKSSVCSVQPVYNDIHLLAADFSGIVCLWDTRTNKVLVDYHGHVNKYTSLPIHIDDTETIVYGVGEDGYTRFWQCRDGKQLLTLPPPSQVSRETIPCVQLSTRWGGQDGNSGLVMGLNNRLHYYGSLSVYS